MNTSQSGFAANNEGPPPLGRSAANSFKESDARARVRPCLLACVDETERASAVGAHAVAIARSLALDVVLARVLSETVHPNAPPDPIAWQLHQHSQRRDLRQLAEQVGVANGPESVLLLGNPAEELIDWADTNGAALLALATSGDEHRKGLGSTSLQILEHGSVSLLLVPPQAKATRTDYKRIVVPIDGSARSESVLPVALRIARTHRAQLILCHVVPRLRGFTPFSSGRSSELRAEIERQNERTARASLEQLRLRAMEDGIDVQFRMLGPEDPRHALCSMTRELDADLVIISSHGATALSDVPCGSVAEYLASHCAMPVLMLRPNLVTGLSDDFYDGEGQSAFRFG